MEYTDKQLKNATQVAYLNCIEDTIKNFMADGKKGPFTVRDIIMANINLKSVEKNLRLEGINKSAKDLSVQELVEYSEIIDFDKEIVKRLSDDVLDWKIIDIHDKNYENGFYGCVIETSKNDAIVAFRGSEGLNDYKGLVNDWIKADFGLFKNECTEQQKETERFLDSLCATGILDKYNSIAATGHSLGGNLASHFAIASAIGENRAKVFDKLNQVINFDGPGVSKEYLKYHKGAIEKAGKKITHYKWSLVGEALNDIPGEAKEFLDVTDDMKKEPLYKHATTSLKFSKTGKAVRGKQDTLSKLIHGFTVASEYVPGKEIANLLLPNNISNAIGKTASILRKMIYQKKNGSIGLGINQEDELKYEDTIISGMIYNNLEKQAKKLKENTYNGGKDGHKDVTDAVKSKHHMYGKQNTEIVSRGLQEYYKYKRDYDIKKEKSDITRE